jgi:hypothetical protein
MFREAVHNIRKVVLGLLLFSEVTFSLYSQGTSIGGIINEYASVVAIGTDNVTLNDVSMFAPEDTVLLIQMKGAIMDPGRG